MEQFGITAGRPLQSDSEVVYHLAESEVTLCAMAAHTTHPSGIHHAPQKAPMWDAD